MEPTPDTKRRKPGGTTVLPSEPRIQIAPDLGRERETMPTIPDLEPSPLAREIAFPSDTIPAPPLAEHDEPED